MHDDNFRKVFWASAIMNMIKTDQDDDLLIKIFQSVIKNILVADDVTENLINV